MHKSLRMSMGLRDRVGIGQAATWQAPFPALAEEGCFQHSMSRVASVLTSPLVCALSLPVRFVAACRRGFGHTAPSSAEAARTCGREHGGRAGKVALFDLM